MQWIASGIDTDSEIGLMTEESGQLHGIMRTGTTVSHVSHIAQKSCA
jgi:fibrillarin-like rRNA methylase